MAQTTIAASLTLDSSQAETSVKSFKAQLREATNDLIAIQQKFGEVSPEAIAAAKSVAQLKASIKDAKEVAELFNPETKFQAFGNAVRASVGGITALTGAMALFGSESKEVQEALLKVQGALALTEGINTLADAAKDFSRLKTVAVDAFNGIKAAIGSTGIGAIVIAVGLLVAYWDDIKEAVGIASAAQKKNLEIATQAYELEKQKLDIITSQNNIYKEQGRSQQQILDIERVQAENVVLHAKLQLAAAQEVANVSLKAANDAKLNALAAGNLGFLNKIVFGDPEKVKAEQDKNLAGYKKALTDAQNLVAGYHLDAIKQQSDFNQKILDLNHAAAEASITDQYALSQIRLKNQYDAEVERTKIEYTNAGERNDVLKALEEKFEAERAALAKANNKKHADERRQSVFDAYISGIPDQEVVAELQLKFQLDKDKEQARYEISDLQARNEKVAELQSVYDAKLATMRLKSLQDFQDKYRDSIIAAQVADEVLQRANLEKDAPEIAAEDPVEKQKEQNKNSLQLSKELGDMKLDQAGQQAAAQLAQLEEWYSTKLKLAGDNEESIRELTKEYERQKTLITDEENQARLSIISGVLGQAATLFSQASAAGKILAIAQATIDTYQSAVASYKALAGIPIVGPALGFAAAGVAIAAGLANVKKIASVQVPGASSSGVGSIGGSAQAPLQVTPQVGNTQLPQQQINQIGNSAQPVKAFVVESDITGSQDRIKRLNRAARLGG